MSLLRTENLSKQFGGLHAVRNVDLSLEANRIRALIGPNGAGKTTLVGMLCGRIEPSSGRVWFEERDVSSLPAHARISLGMAYTFQITSIFANLPVDENVALAARRLIRDPQECASAVGQALARVGLQDWKDQRAGDLSYGHQRLLEIAMGLVQRPTLLILDEPTQGLASSEIDAFVALIRELKSQTTILLIEHNMDVVMGAADEVTVLNFGEILAEGTPAAIKADPAVQAAYLGAG